MKKLVVAVALMMVSGMAIAGNTKAPAQDLSAQVTFGEKGDRLYCYVAILGVPAGKTVRPVVKWTAPSESPLFRNGEPFKSRAVRTSTKCYRTLVTQIEGRIYRALGTWKAEVYVGDVKIGEGSYTVK